MMNILGLFSNFWKVIVFKNRLDRAKFYLDPDQWQFEMSRLPMLEIFY